MNKQSNKVLITGANGFVGSHLIKALALDYKIYYLSHELLIMPINLEATIKKINPDYIFHLAAYGNMANQKDEAEVFNANLGGIFNLLQTTHDIDYKGFINISTSSVNLPYQTLYSATKKGAEALCAAYISQYNKPVVSIRPYSLYGEREANHRFIPTVFDSCLNNTPMTLSQGSHDWVYIKDFINFIIEASKKAGSSEMPSVLEFGSGINTTNAEVVKMIEEITGKKANIVEHKDLRSLDMDKWQAKDKQAKTTLKEGLIKYYEWYKEQRA